MFTSNMLLIHRDRVKRGSEAVYRTAEEDAARFCARLGCPHPHLAVESLTEPIEVLWFNALDSEAHKQQIVDAYASNGPLTTALAGIRTRREGLLDLDVDVLARHEPELTRGGPWPLGRARFLVVTMTRGDEVGEGAVYVAEDGTRFVFRPAEREAQAREAAAAAGREARVFAVRPYWGMAAKEWIAADPEFWSANPSSAAG